MTSALDSSHPRQSSHAKKLDDIRTTQTGGKCARCRHINHQQRQLSLNHQQNRPTLAHLDPNPLSHNPHLQQLTLATNTHTHNEANGDIGVDGALGRCHRKVCRTELFRSDDTLEVRSGMSLFDSRI
jgi:hypothetical protein